MTKPHQPSFNDYLNEFNQLIQIHCEMNATAYMEKEVASCYQKSLTLEECLDYVDQQCGLSDLYLKLEE